MYKSLFLVFWCIVHIWIFTISSSTYHSGFFNRSYISLIMWLVMWPCGVGLKCGLLCKWFSLKKSIALETSRRFLDMLNKCTSRERKCDWFVLSPAPILWMCATSPLFAQGCGRCPAEEFKLYFNDGGVRPRSLKHTFHLLSAQTNWATQMPPEQKKLLPARSSSSVFISARKQISASFPAPNKVGGKGNPKVFFKALRSTTSHCGLTWNLGRTWWRKSFLARKKQG